MNRTKRGGAWCTSSLLCFRVKCQAPLHLKKMLRWFNMSPRWNSFVCPFFSASFSSTKRPLRWIQKRFGKVAERAGGGQQCHHPAPPIKTKARLRFTSGDPLPSGKTRVWASAALKVVSFRCSQIRRGSSAKTGKWAAGEAQVKAERRSHGRLT